MGPDVRFLKNPQPSNIGNRGLQQRSRQKQHRWHLCVAQRRGRPPRRRARLREPYASNNAHLRFPTHFSTPEARRSTLRTPRVLQCSFMQPTRTSCRERELLIGTAHLSPNDKRINFNRITAGFTLEIFPGNKPSTHVLRSALKDEGILRMQ